jgi:hypothetical protein
MFTFEPQIDEMTANWGFFRELRDFSGNVHIFSKIHIANSIETVGVVDHEILSKIVVANLDGVQQRGIGISAIPCDGARY